MKVVNINDSWEFFKGISDISKLKGESGEVINLPHTWNNLDGQDGGNDYFRGSCVYSKVVDINKKSDNDYYIEFRGANAVATLYINNQFVGEHKGGFSTFRWNITDYILLGHNNIVVKVDNSPMEDVYPQMADFTFFGGLYRSVYLIETEKSRFDLDYYGSDGVMITPTLKSKNLASVNVKAFVTNPQPDQNIFIEIFDQGKTILTGCVPATTATMDFELKDPKLWDGVESPCLYKTKIKLVQDEEVLDERVVEWGVRECKVDKDGYWLNGRKYPLRGVSRHQDRQDMGWAITIKEHEQDMQLIKEVGANSIRLAHYQHDQYFYDLCDKNGMVVWAEIPYISMHLDKGDDNAINQMRELIIQNYNHPSICIWGISNEITIGGENQNQYKLHQRLNELCHGLDPTRQTTIANVSMLDIHSPIIDIPDMMAYNHYFGWYVGEVDDNAKWLDEWRREFPNKPIGLSEYGCEAVLDYHTTSPRQGDYTQEYQAYYHEKMLEIFEKRPYLWCTYVWNMFDFGVDGRNEGGVKGRNNKGLVSYDRKTKKDSFFVYKAHWSKEPFVHIASKSYNKRQGQTTKIKVYSNCDEVGLYVGKTMIDAKKGRYVFEFSIPLSFVPTRITAVGKGVKDSFVLRRVFKEPSKYTLKNNANEVANWFEIDGKKVEFEYREGYFSIRDKIGDIMQNEQGKQLLEIVLDRASEQTGMKMQGGMLKMVSLMSIERIAGLMGDKMKTKDLYELNKALQNIKK